MQIVANSVQLISGGNVIKQGDETPFVFQLNDETGEPIEIQGATVKVKVANEKVVVLEKTATINSDNTLSFFLSKNDVAGNGDMRLEFTVTYANGKVGKFPAAGWQEIRITPSLDDVSSGTVAVVTVEKIKQEYQQQIDTFKTEVNQKLVNVDQQAANAKTQADRAKAETDRLVGVDAAQFDSRLTAVSEQLAQTSTEIQGTSQGIPLAPLSNVTITNNYTGVVPLVFHDGWLYGFKNNITIVKSNDEGKTWIDIATAPYGSVHSIFWTNDGEIVITNSAEISKSSGWSVNPATATWSKKVTKSKSTGVGILPWGINGNGTKFIATEYSASDRSESRYVWISTDMGNTWNVVLDKYTIDPNNLSHMHGVCYDKWEDRFFLSHGHGDIYGVYYSDDNGVNWNKIGGTFQPNAAPTTLTATDNGIVCGSDSIDTGLYGIARTNNPIDMRMKPIARWDIEVEGVTGFAYRGVRDEKTGQVYVSFKSDHNGVASAIMAGTATTGSQLWKSPTVGFSVFTNLAVTNENIFGLITIDSVNELISAKKPTFGVASFDSGNITNGKSNNPTSIAIGKNVEVSSANEVVIGTNASLEATSSKTGNVVIGNSSKGTARSVAIGNNAQVYGLGGDAVAIGNTAKVAATNGIAIGNDAEIPSGMTGSIAIGSGTEASTGGIAIGIGATTGGGTTNGVSVGSSAYAGTSSVAVGRLASAGTQQVAIGLSAKANHLNSIALGANVTTTAGEQLNIGARHIEMKKVTEPTTVPADTGRLFVMDDGAGNMRLCVRLGAKTTVLATSV
ncbi:hypothetical protein ACFYKT_16715 [Cytobacillus sp. FJAT-53684]|uniref:Trimeric autotransporter adhesin YadA-like head domain-containing protein n=1 Tax=Cytobacillus mangrovibacter TaxID=3299024 RepID=A0ABW6K1D9_9BACI